MIIPVFTVWRHQAIIWTDVDSESVSLTNMFKAHMYQNQTQQNTTKD